MPSSQSSLESGKYISVTTDLFDHREGEVSQLHKDIDVNLIPDARQKLATAGFDCLDVNYERPMLVVKVADKEQVHVAVDRVKKALGEDAKKMKLVVGQWDVEAKTAA